MKPSRDAAIATAARVAHRADVSGFVVSLLLDPGTVKVAIRGKQGYRAVLLDPQRCDSGYVVVTSQGPGNQRPDSTAYRVEEYLDMIRERMPQFRLSEPEDVAVIEMADKIRSEAYKAQQPATVAG